MQHLSLYDASFGANAALVQDAAVADAIIAPAGNGFLVGVLNKIMRVAAVGTNLVRAQLTSASIRDFAPFDLAPLTAGAVIGTPALYQDFSDSPIPLSTNEELDAFVLHTAIGPDRVAVAVWFADGPVRKITARPFTVHWTQATVALAANAWTAITPVLDNGIPSGTFAIIGARFQSAGALFARFIPRGGSAFRPGGFAQQAATQDPQDGSRYGGMGEWMRFTNVTLPQIEFYSRSADATQEGYLDLVQVG